MTDYSKLDEIVESNKETRRGRGRVCCGGIVCMGEADQDRTALLQQLANLPQHPQSVPINLLVQVENTPFDKLGIVANGEQQAATESSDTAAA